MTCPVCGGAAEAGVRCPQCGAPDVPEDAARALAEARVLAASGDLDRSIRVIHAAVKAAPGAALPHLRLAEAYERKMRGGETALTSLADREFREALRLAPADRDVHISRLGFWTRAGRLNALRLEYTRRREELPFADECLRILDTLERSGAVAGALDAASGATALRARYLFISAAGLGVIGLVEVSVVVYSAMRDDEYVMMSDMNFFVAVAGLTTAAILVDRKSVV